MINYPKQAIIVAGGKGLRLGRKTKNLPKPLIKIFGKPFLFYIIKFLLNNKIRNITILAGYKGDLIKKFINDNFKKQNIKTLIEKKELGTGGALINNLKFFDKRFFYLNADSYLKINFAKLNINKLVNSLKNIIFITKNINYKSNKLLSNLRINKNNKINNSKINKSKMIKSMYAGISILDKKKLLSLNLHKDEFISFEKDIIEKLIFKDELYGISINNFFIDIGTKNNLKEANKNFVKKISEKCCFFDRDNTLIYDKGYTYKINDLKWKNGAIKAIKYLNSKGYKVIIITNQSGIGRGYFKESDLNKFHNEMNRRLNKEKANIDEFFYCPYSIHGKGKYKKISVDRKPNNGMLIKAINKWNIDIKKSIMIGNSHTDYLSAKKTKLKYFYVQNNLYSQIKKIIK